MSRDIATALRSEPSPAPDGFNRLLDRQLLEARGRNGQLDLRALLSLVSGYYDRVEAERRGIVRSMRIMSDEAQALTREIREETASHLQAILDNVKDAIITVDETGHIETFNPTGERLFGYSPEEIFGRTLDFLLPDIGRPPHAKAGAAVTRSAADHLVEFLERSAATNDDTHVDLAAHQMWGLTEEGTRVAVEIAVSKASLNRRVGYIVCVRDSTERKRADAIAAGERRVFEKIAANAPLAAALEAIAEVVERVIPGTFCAVNLLDPERQSLSFGVAPRLPRAFLLAMDHAPIGLRFGSCAAAVHLARQITVSDIEVDALWECRREAARHGGLRASWSAPIVASDGVIVGTLSTFRNQPGTPSPTDHELLSRMAQIASIAIERRGAEDALRDSEAKFRSLFESVMEGVYRTSRDGQLLVVNPAFVQMLGYDSAEEICQVPAASLYWYPSDREAYIRRIEGEGEVRNVEYVLRRKDGSMLVVVDNGRVLRDKQGRISGFEGTIADVTERKKAEMAVFQAEERAQVTLQSIGDAVITTDSAGRIDYMNPVAESLTGWENREAQSRLIGDVLTVVDEATREPAESPVIRCLREGHVLGLAEHTVLVNRRGQEIAIQDSAAPIRDRGGNLIGAVMVFHDISKERRLHRALHFQASHDALTGLINRREFENRLTTAVEGARQDADSRQALLYLDLDQFKLVNDTCGHPAGDQLLKQVTGVLQSRLRGGDTLARLGGDEFGILLQACSLDQALRLAENLRQAIRDYRFVWHERRLRGRRQHRRRRDHPRDRHRRQRDERRRRRLLRCQGSGPQSRASLQTGRRAGAAPRDAVGVEAHARVRGEPASNSSISRSCPSARNPHDREHFELCCGCATSRAPSSCRSSSSRRLNATMSCHRSIAGWCARRSTSWCIAAGRRLRPYTIAVNLSGTSLNDERFLEYLIAELSARELGPARCASRSPKPPPSRISATWSISCAS